MDCKGNRYRLIKEDTRSLDHSSFEFRFPAAGRFQPLHHRSLSTCRSFAVDAADEVHVPVAMVDRYCGLVAVMPMLANVAATHGLVH